MATLAENVAEAIDLIKDYKKVLSGQNTVYYLDLTIPKETTAIRSYAFYKFRVGTGGLYTVVIPASVTGIGYGAFYDSRIVSVDMKGVQRLFGGAFAANGALTTVNIPNTLSGIYLGNRQIEWSEPFEGCSNLQYVTIENGFNCNWLNLSYSTKYSVDTIVSWLNALADRTGQPAYTLTIGSTNLAKLTAEQIAIATNKNWNLA